jgi:hypothetical protein
MLKRIGALSAVLVASVLAVMLGAAPAHADGAAVVGVPDFVMTSNGGTVATCSASGYANWFVYPEGDAAVQYGGSTTCSRYVKMNGTAELILNGGGTVASNSFSHLLALSGSAYGLIVSSPGTTYFIRYTTTVWAPIGFSWTTVPPQCTVSAPKITCTMLTPFTVS